MSVDLHVEFLNPRSLLESQGLERFLRELVAYGFDIKDISVGKGRAEHPQPEESATQLLEHARRECLLSFHAAIPTMRGDYSFEFGADLAWGAELLQGDDRIWMGMTSWSGPLVNYPEYDPAYHSDLLLDIGTWLYSTLAPDFGWIDFGQTGGYTWFDDIEQSRIPHIYWANYFGLDYLTRVGRQKVESAPAWRIRGLDNGGLLYVLASTPASTSDHVEIDRVKAHFGIDSVR